MNDELQPMSADRVPTLTEVLELGAPSAGDPALPAPVELPPVFAELVPALVPELVPEPAPVPAPAPAIDTAALVTEVLGELQPRLDMLFESRLREALAPALARAAEGLIRDARSELGTALHELVDDAVKRALQRRGGAR